MCAEIPKFEPRDSYGPSTTKRTRLSDSQLRNNESYLKLWCNSRVHCLFRSGVMGFFWCLHRNSACLKQEKRHTNQHH
uniref:Uncharacterized protein n=1 Tax=Timema monikensis TaxID=170555 RepID=A0A7R9HLK4_9NEOP|nr:unnamed protein product [Timema monikensis]